MSDKIILGCAELGTYSTDAPNPHINLAGATCSGYAIVQLFTGAMANGDTCTVTIRKDATNWAVYSNALFTTGTPNIIDLTAAVLEESTGTLSDTDPVEVLGIMPSVLQTTDPLQERIAALEAGSSYQGAGTYLISGGTVAWVSGYTYRVGLTNYMLNGTATSAVEQEVTLDAADESFDRFDALILDSTGTLGEVAGTASANPSLPTVDPDTYYVVTYVLVKAATTDAPIVSTEIYTEGSEWTATASGATIVVDSTNNPRTGTNCIEGTAVVGGNYVTAVAAAPFNPNQYNNVVFYIRHKAAWTKQKSIRLTWLSSTTQRGTPVIIGDGAYGLNTQVTGAYQQVVVPMSAFAIPAGLTVDRLRWEVTGGSGAVGFYLDDWLLQAGISTEPAPIMLYRGAWSTDTVYNTNIVVSRSGGTYIALEPNQGEDPLTSASWARLSSSLFLPSSYYPGVPEADAILLGVVGGPFTVTYAASFTGWRAYAKVAATAQTDCPITLDGVSVGTLRFAAGAQVGTWIVVAAVEQGDGELLEITAPATPDATLAGIYITGYGLRS